MMPTCGSLVALFHGVGITETAAAAARDVFPVRSFYTIEWFTAALSDPIDAAHIAEGLEKAGLSKTEKSN